MGHILDDVHHKSMNKFTATAGGSGSYQPLIWLLPLFFAGNAGLVTSF